MFTIKDKTVFGCILKSWLLKCGQGQQPTMAMDSSQTPEKVTIVTRSTPFILGAVSGALSTVMFQPLDLIKTRMQLQVMANNSHWYVVYSIKPDVCVIKYVTVQFTHSGLVRLNTLDTLVNVVRKDTVLGLWKGVSPVSVQ